MNTPEDKTPNTQEASSMQRMGRPVRCYLCNRPMHYAGQAGHVPELRVEVFGDDSAEFYVHVSCWNERMASGPNDQALPQGGAKKGNDEH